MGASSRAFARIASHILLAAAVGLPTSGAAQERSAPIRVTDPRLAAALSRLLAGSPTARSVVGDLADSGLPVTIGTPSDLTESRGGDEAGALLPEPARFASASGPQMAWVAFLVAMPADAPSGSLGQAERAWVVVDADRIAELVRVRGGSDAEARIEDDLTIALGHELVAHVGSLARTRRVEDFCDDPPPGAAPKGELACSLQVENKVRQELNRSLALQGARRFAERRSYSTDVMNFATGGR